MSDQHLEKDTATTTTVSQHDPLRRAMLGGVAAATLLAGVGCNKKGAYAQGSKAASDKKEEEAFNSYNRQRRFEKNEMDAGTPWTPNQTGNFDLNDPIQNSLAKMKMTNNLVGARTYVPMLVRMVIGREQNPGGLLLGAASMFTWQLQVPDPKEFPNIPEGTALMRSMYTAVYLDPQTMEPVKSIKNPFNGTTMELEDYLFVENFLSFPKGGSRFVEELQFSNDDPDKPKTSLIKQWGDDAIIYAGGTYSEPGVHQPRFTENTWRCSMNELMDPDVSRIDTSYNFMGANKAYEKPWTGHTVDDQEMLFSLATGKKVHSVEDIPDYHKRVLLEAHPDRV